MTDSKKQRRKSAFDELEKQVKVGDLFAKEAEEERSRRPVVKFGVLADEPESELGQRLQEARRGAGLTQDELAEKSKRIDIDGKGVSGAVISLYERGVNRPGPREIRILCEILRISPNYLIYGNEDPFEDRTQYSRYWGWARSEAELYAAMSYCFTRLHKHHKGAIMELMMGLLRGWNKNFDNELDAKAVKTFLQHADELRLELAKRRKEKP